MRPFRITVPNWLGDKDLVPFFGGWVWRQDLRGDVVIDFEKAGFLSPWVITLFAIYALWLHEVKKLSVSFSFETNTPAGKYALKAGLAELIEKGSGPVVQVPEYLTTPLTRIRTSSEIPSFATNVMKILRIEDEELGGAIEYSLIELLRNVVQHSYSKVGGLAMAQHYPNTGLVEVVVADFGIGVQRSMRSRYSELSGHLDALKLALLPHVSGTFPEAAYGAMKDNAGLGLFFIKEIATRAGGGFFLGSGDALVDLWGNADGSAGRKYVRSRVEGWPGTFAVLQLRKDQIGDFVGLLSYCRELAANARKDPSELALDFIDEIPDIDGIVTVNVRDFKEDVERAARVREDIVIPAITGGQMVVLDFSGIRTATQSFAHACMYRVLRDFPRACNMLSLSGCTPSTKEALKAVAAYAIAEPGPRSGSETRS